MNIKVGDKIVHGEHDFVVINIKKEETIEGIGLLIQCTDPETADHIQQNKIKTDKVGEGLLDALRKALDKGGHGGIGFGFPLGGGEQ